MSSCIGFSTCGVGPDHPHDMHSSVTVPINHVLRAFKGEATHSFDGSSTSTSSLILLLVDLRELRFECFSGGPRARDLALEALRASGAANHPQAPFLAATSALMSSSTAAQNSDEHQSADAIVLPPGEKSRQKFSCTLHALRDETGTLHVTSAALLWLPNLGEESSSVVGFRIEYEDIDLTSVVMSRLGWTDHVVTVGLKSKLGVEKSPIRFLRLTESGARALQVRFVGCTVAADSGTSAF